MAKTSPFEAVHEQLGARFDEFDGWRMPADYGDVEAECLAHKEKCAAFDLSSFGRITVQGRDAELLIARTIHPTAAPAEDRWIRAQAVDTYGEAIGPVRVSRSKDVLTVHTLPADREAVLALCEAHNKSPEIGKAKIADVTEKTGMLALYGPAAYESMRQIVPLDISDLTPGTCKRFSFFLLHVTVLRGSWLGTDGLELMGPASAASMAAGAVGKYRDRYEITPAGMLCLQEAMKGLKP